MDESKTSKLVLVALVISLVAVVIGAIGVVKAKNANEAVTSANGQQAALSTDVNARIAQL